MERITRTLVVVIALMAVPLAPSAIDSPPSSVQASEGAPGPQPFATESRSTDPAPSDDRALVGVGGDDAAHDALVWAAERLTAAGLVIPGMLVAFHDDSEPCEGYDGAFRQNENPMRIDICNPNKYIVIHELVHAWEATAVDAETRNRFMEHQGLEAWNAADVAWSDRGVERFAEVVVWGLTATNGARTDLAKAEAFEIATGIEVTVGSAHQRSSGTEPGAEDYS